jgi:hypothetical protein
MMMKLPGYTAERSLNYGSSQKSSSSGTLLSLPKSNGQIIPAYTRTCYGDDLPWGIDLNSDNLGPVNCIDYEGIVTTAFFVVETYDWMWQ